MGKYSQLCRYIFLVYGVFFASTEKDNKAIETAFVILGITMSGKVIQKFSESK
jgi:hypothetical protein